MAMTPLTTPAPPGPPLELLESTTFLLKRLGMAVKGRSIDAFESTGVTGQHFAVLLVLDEGARETQGAIADALGYDRSLLVGLLDDLEERGLVERRRDPADRRRHVVSLTPMGKEAVTTLRRVTHRLEEEFLAPLDAADRQTLHELLLRLVTHHDIRCAASIRP
jgi:DNA-binding MarR family transcriptional regulator